MIELRVPSRYVSENELTDVLRGYEWTLAAPLSHGLEPTRGLDPGITAAAIAGGFGLVEAALAAVLTHILARRRDKEERQLRPVNPAQVEVRIVRGSDRLEPQNATCSKTSDCAEMAKRVGRLCAAQIGPDQQTVIVEVHVLDP